MAFAYHDVGVRCLSVLLAHGIDVRLVVTHRDDPAERAWFGSVERLALERGLAVRAPEAPGDPALVRELQAIAPDFVFSFYYRRMLPPEVLAAARLGGFNVHGSLLPKYRGRAPVNWAILHGERETGATLHRMEAKPDAGDIVDQLAVPILPDDLAVDVMRKVTVAAEIVLDRSLPALADGSARLTPQDLARGSYFGGRRPDDGRIDWTRGAQEIHNLVRAVAPPYPGAFTGIGPHRLGLHRTRLLEERGDPGRACLVIDGDAARIDCADGGCLRILAMALDGEPVDARTLRARLGAGPHGLAP